MTDQPRREPTASGWVPRGTPQVNFRAGELLPELEARANGANGAMSLAAVASHDLDRYYTLLRSALAKIAPTLTAGEAAMIVDALNGLITEPHTASLLWASVADAIESDGLARKWDVDGAALVERLRRLAPFEALAVADAAERYWNRVAAGVDETNDERLRAVGLLA